MTLEEAEQILKYNITNEGGLHTSHNNKGIQEYIDYSPGDDEITLDCNFTLEQLEAIVVYMKSKQ